MDAELKRKWIEALRSGKYKQCSRALYNGEGFCCLGVYADLSGVDRNIMLAHADALGDIDGQVAPLSCLNEIAGLHMRYYLSRLNDNGKSFSEIADYIEANL